jgi:alginate O-acetyltransferase complex protein AlgI
VFWGSLHGLYLVINHAWQALRLRLGGNPAHGSTAGRALARMVTFLAVVVAWVFFRAENFDAALVVLRGMCGLSGVMLPTEYQTALGILASSGIAFGKLAHGGGWPLLFVLLLVVWFAPNSIEMLRRYRPALTRFPGAVLMATRTPLTWRANRVWMLLTAALLLASILSMAEVSEFLYFQF